jgi:hypothetical protein
MEKMTFFFRGCTAALLFLFLTGDAWARDPFWPLGYESRPVLKPVDNKVSTTVVNQPLTPRKRIVSADDWAAARKLVQMTGFASAGGRQIAFFNGKSYRNGDKLTLVNDGIQFTWRVEILGERKAELVQVEAVLQ